jgi:hypothetical protein
MRETSFVGPGVFLLIIREPRARNIRIKIKKLSFVTCAIGFEKPAATVDSSGLLSLLTLLLGRKEIREERSTYLTPFFTCGRHSKGLLLPGTTRLGVRLSNRRGPRHLMKTRGSRHAACNHLLP